MALHSEIKQLVFSEGCLESEKVENHYPRAVEANLLVLEPTFVGCCLHKCLTYYIGNVPGKNLEGTHRSLSKQLFVRRFLYLTELGKARI
ncbi:hypothetical protein Y1Q_0021779 [Alligator mississippiensis]|uniref:Uncharacterized protein n=1 Tax=Alligator mississippiensis TaxID=8496 RepID=A0A151PB20_ALLMI|nr:hypothetical protein Y1Q_0021779 [Alligator mississippiensis]